MFFDFKKLDNYLLLVGNLNYISGINIFNEYFSFLNFMDLNKDWSKLNNQLIDNLVFGIKDDKIEKI